MAALQEIERYITVNDKMALLSMTKEELLDAWVCSNNYTWPSDSKLKKEFSHVSVRMKAVQSWIVNKLGFEVCARALINAISET